MSELAKVSARVAEVVLQALEIEPDSSHELALGEHPAWDSLGHARVVFAVSEEFGVQFKPRDIEAAVDPESIARFILRLQTANG